MGDLRQEVVRIQDARRRSGYRTRQCGARQRKGLWGLDREW